ncbi:hypothetical protein HMPREF0044_0334 [Gleimia coleocanis DSM 15436]|uniref:THAP4-like heme-binding domain-containing protein n=1 Tax=Gleimia coleocanis DSM 15436 TaxID=525245 RepID=C0VYU4_9ACTO|nr:heme-binding beta-barrel domain-containing protein [Gleimia coleocanis]EEH64597.1 hypothetical protein HMPREF0044_0334 [Gleimia coleocanis DSM 15436]
MINIPDNLPLAVAPLTFLLGTWQGWGVFTDTPSETNENVNSANVPVNVSHCLLEYDAQVIDDCLRVTRTVWNTQDGVTLDNETPVWEGVNALRRTSIAWQSTAYWTIIKHPNYPDGVVIQAFATANTGNVTLWNGTAKGPRVQLTLDTSAAVASARTLEYGQQMLGMAESDLFLVETLQFTDSELTLSGRLTKVAEADPIELLSDGPALAGYAEFTGE